MERSIGIYGINPGDYYIRCFPEKINPSKVKSTKSKQEDFQIFSNFPIDMPCLQTSQVQDMREVGFSDAEIKERIPLKNGLGPIIRDATCIGVPLLTSTLGFYEVNENLIKFPNQDWLVGLSFIATFGGLFFSGLMYQAIKSNPAESREEKIRKTAEANRFYKKYGMPKKGLENYTLDNL